MAIEYKKPLFLSLSDVKLKKVCVAIYLQINYYHMITVK